MGDNDDDGDDGDDDDDDDDDDDKEWCTSLTRGSPWARWEEELWNSSISPPLVYHRHHRYRA